MRTIEIHLTYDQAHDIVVDFLNDALRDVEDMEIAAALVTTIQYFTDPLEWENIPVPQMLVDEYRRSLANLKSLVGDWEK